MSENVNGVRVARESKDNYGNSGNISIEPPDNSVFNATAKLYDKAVKSVDEKQPNPDAVTKNDINNIYKTALSACEDIDSSGSHDGVLDMKCADGSEIKYKNSDTNTAFEYKLGPHSVALSIDEDKKEKDIQTVFNDKTDANNMKWYHQTEKGGGYMVLKGMPFDNKYKK